jgi:RNA 3'-terminal phosphate cyclase (ATP)
MDRASEQPGIVLDGSAGEGGGQVLRTALSLSAVTGRGFRVERLRADRLKSGLRPQHREAARAIARIVDARLEGDQVGSAALSFAPRASPRAGEWAFDVGTAGSTPLLLQTICWPLALAGAPSFVTLRGGTHLDQAPSFHYLALVWAPAVARLGFTVEAELQEAGFYPDGVGELTARIRPAQPMPPLDLRHRGTLREVEVMSMVGGLPYTVAERQADRALRRLRDAGIAAEAERVPLPARASRGGHVLVVATFERTRAGHGAVGGSEAIPEETADAAVDAFRRHLTGGAAVDRQLADQLLVPAALAVAGRVPVVPGVVPDVRYTVAEVTPHLLTNAEVVRRFLEVEVLVDGREGEEGEVRVLAPGAHARVMPLPRDGGR